MTVGARMSRTPILSATNPHDYFVSWTPITAMRLQAQLARFELVLHSASLPRDSAPDSAS